MEPDVTAVASPILTNGHVIAALNLVVPSYRVKPTSIQRYGAVLADSAAAISAALSAPDEGGAASTLVGGLEVDADVDSEAGEHPTAADSAEVRACG